MNYYNRQNSNSTSFSSRNPKKSYQFSEFSGRLSYQKEQVQQFLARPQFQRTVTFSNFGSSYTLPRSPVFLKRGYSFSLSGDSKIEQRKNRVVHFSDEKPKIPYVPKREKSALIKNHKNRINNETKQKRPHTTTGATRSHKIENDSKCTNLAVSRSKSGISRPKTVNLTSNRPKTVNPVAKPRKYVKNVPKIEITSESPKPETQTKNNKPDLLKVPEKHFEENNHLNSSLQSLTLEKFIYKKQENQRVTDKIEDWFSRVDM